MKLISTKSGYVKEGHEKSQKVTKTPRHKRGPSIPEPAKMRMQQLYVAGMNVAQIAQETGHCWRTVSRVVKAERVRQYIQDLQEKFYGEMDEVLLAAIIYAKTKDGWLAYEMAKDAGVIPQLADKRTPGFHVLTQPTPTEEQSAIREIAIGLVEGAIERQRFFEMESPEIQEIEEKLKKAKEKKAGTLQH